MKLRLSHVGTGRHGFPLVRVEEVGETTEIESSNPRELAAELERQARAGGIGFEIVGTLPDAPDKPFPGWDPVGELLEAARGTCERCGSAMDDNVLGCDACRVAGGGI